MAPAASYLASDPAAEHWDVAVIGTGMGGATAGYELARRGRKVLFIEKGLFLQDPALAAGAAPAADSPQARLRAGQWPLRLRGSTSFGELDFFAPLGCGTGGTTFLYAAALERFAPADFAPRANFPQAGDSSLPERWPISYEELRPYYERAEALFRVRGTPDPLYPAAGEPLRAPPPLAPRDQHLFDSFRRLGLHPYRVHVAYEFVEGCAGCAQGACVRACKNDAGRICLLPALETFGASLLPQCDVLALDATGTEVSAIRCRWQGREIAIRAKVVILAAGAYMTPVLLLNSRSPQWPEGLANRSDRVGRNLMFHASDFIALMPRERLSNPGPQKTLALNDFYQVAGEKLGTFQTAGAAVSVGQIMQYMRDVAERERAWWMKLASPRPVWWRKASSPAIRLAALALYHAFNFKNAAVWASIVEDLPYHDNRVLADPAAANGMRFEYHYSDELKKRVASFRRRLAERLRPHRLFVLSRENNLNFGHVCGTCRFGDDPATSVLDRNNRAHDLANLYVVDASFLPSSAGTNPSLTIAANALRVAGAVHAQLG